MHFHQVPHQSSARMSGFTLIELMITAVIVAILAAIALPSYASYIARARRADARTQLVQAAQFMQRFYTANDSYSEDRAGNDVINRMPGGLKQSPADSAKLYDLAIPSETLTATNFVLRMVPVVGGAMANDPCGTFTMSSTGLRGILVGDVQDNASSLRDSCWK
ncbi:MAG: fimbrial protein [Polaromonas sp.]|jgi:type IV pilus assembly protein PilE|nr:fimbrial protein [Polaromonas sp.]